MDNDIKYQLDYAAYGLGYNPLFDTYEDCIEYYKNNTHGRISLISSYKATNNTECPIYILIDDDYTDGVYKIYEVKELS